MAKKRILGLYAIDAQLQSRGCVRTEYLGLRLRQPYAAMDAHVQIPAAE
jgi:hypothetical protein